MTGNLPLREIAAVQARLAWMRQARIWPNGLRYLWTDAFGVVLLVSLWHELRDERLLRECEWVVAEVERVLARRRGIRIGEEPDRDGQYFHYLAMWIFALDRLGAIDARYRAKAIALVRDIHPAFVIPGTGVIWKMREDLSAPYPGFGLGALDAFHGLVVYRLLDPAGLAPEIAEMTTLVERELSDPHDHPGSRPRHDALDEPLLPRRAVGRRSARAGLGYARPHVGRPARLFLPRAGAASRQVRLHQLRRLAGPAGGGRAGDRVRRLNAFFDGYHSGDEYDTNAITHVMACTSHFPGCCLGAKPAP